MTLLDLTRRKLEEHTTELRARLRAGLLAAELNRNSQVVIDRVDVELECSFKLFWAGHQDDLILLGQKHANKTKPDGLGSIWSDFVRAFDQLNTLEREVIGLRKTRGADYEDMRRAGGRVVNLPVEDEVPAFLR